MSRLSGVPVWLAGLRATGGPAVRVFDNRSAGLDALRSIACLLVVIFHMRTMLVTDFGPLNPIVEGGNSGVFVFFALSGYLLYKPFVRGNGQVDLQSYSIKRTARIVPGYFIALIALAILTQSPLPAEHPLPYLSITSSYNIPLRGFLGVAWTLSAEILFYLLLPITARLVNGNEILRLSAIALVSVIATLIHRIALNDDNMWLIGSFPVVAYAFVPGMILAVVEVKHPGIFKRLAQHVVLALGIALLVIGCITLADPIALPTVVGTMLVMGWLLQHRVPGARTLAFMGGASYAMYLWHRDLFISFGVAGVVIAAIGAALSWAIIERPILDLAHRLAAHMRRAKPGDPVVVSSPATST
jgi:peptidoglycan/LPS O-acetylase OafA/YrhL